MVLHPRLQPFLFEPEKAHGQLPQIISRVTGWQLAGASERVGGVSSKRRDILFGSAFHG
jgi:hypothetical protein